MKNKDKYITKSILKNILSRDIPSKLGSDNEMIFKSDEIKNYVYFNIVHILENLIVPQTQGFVENKNKQIKNSISLYMNKYNTKQYFDLLIVFVLQ